MFKRILIIFILMTMCGVQLAYAGDDETQAEKRMRSGSNMVLAGYLIGAAGGAVAIGGSIYAAAQTNHRMTAAIIGGSGAGLALVGGFITILGYHKQSQAERFSSSIEPQIDPQNGQYRLKYSLLF